MAVRARTEAPPVRALPVREVVARAVVRRRAPSSTPRTSRSRRAPSRSSASSYMSACRSSSGAATSPRRIWRASFVPSSMISAYAETWSGSRATRGLQRRPPVLERLPRCAVDEVEADIEPGSARGADGGADVRGLVGAVERRKDVRDGRLHADRQPGDAGCRQLGGDRSVTVSGFASTVTSASGVDAERGAHALEHAREIARRQQGGRAPAEEHRRARRGAARRRRARRARARPRAGACRRTRPAARRAAHPRCRC